MSNLVPELRVNKNGVPVTKHVLADKTSRQSSSRVPPPSVNAHPSPDLLARLDEEGGEVAKLLAFHLRMPKYRLSKKGLQELLGTLHEDTLESVESLIRSSDSPWHMFDNMIAHCIKEREFATLNNIAVLDSEVRGMSDQKYRSLDMHVIGLQAHQESTADWSSLGAEEKEGMRAVFRASLLLDFNYLRHVEIGKTIKTAYPSTCIKSEALHGLIYEHPESVDSIISILNERKLSIRNEQDTKTLMGLVSQNVEPSLSSGLL